MGVLGRLPAQSLIITVCMKNTFGLAVHRLSEVVLGGSRSSKSGTLIEEALSTMAVDLALKQDDEAQSIQALQEQKADLDAMPWLSLSWSPRAGLRPSNFLFLAITPRTRAHHPRIRQK